MTVAKFMFELFRAKPTKSAINPDIKYVLIEIKNEKSLEKFILAESRLSTIKTEYKEIIAKSSLANY